MYETRNDEFSIPRHATIDRIISVLSEFQELRFLFCIYGFATVKRKIYSGDANSREQLAQRVKTRGSWNSIELLGTVCTRSY